MNLTQRSIKKLLPVEEQQQQQVMILQQEKPKMCWKWIIIGFSLLLIIVAIALLLYFLVFDKKETSSQKLATTPAPGPMDNSIVVERFRRVRELWYILSVDTTFLFLINTLMTINSNIVQPQSLSNSMALRDAYHNLDKYVETHLLPTLPTKTIIRIIFADGILFYDSSLTMQQTYYMQNDLPHALSTNTLGSPLKDHNTFPENFNALMIHHPSDPANFLGTPLTHQIYKDLSMEGFGFIERISSSLSSPATFLSRFLTLSTDPNTFFMNGCVLALAVPISSLTTST